MSVAILVPMLGRPHRVAPLLDSIEANTPEHHRVVFLCTPSDLTVHDAVQQAGHRPLLVPWEPVGDYARKSNVGYQATSDALLFLAADDLRFHPHWLERAAGHLDDGIGVVGTNDLCNPRVMRGVHATHSLVTRAYIDEHGTIDEHGKVLHEGYVHEYVDDELVGTAKKRGAWSFAADSIVEHLHPDAGKAPMDDLYAQQGARMLASRQHYKQRRRLWT